MSIDKIRNHPYELILKNVSKRSKTNILLNKTFFCERFKITCYIITAAKCLSNILINRSFFFFTIFTLILIFTDSLILLQQGFNNLKMNDFISFVYSLNPIDFFSVLH